MTDSLDFIEEIRVAQFWRKQLGEMEYVNRNPEDLRRWYDALETRGPDEIRAYLIERTGRHPAGEVTGIVAKAPHPPREVVDLWLASYDKVSKTPYWAGMAAFLILCVFIVPNMSSCQHLKTPSQFATGAPTPTMLNGASFVVPPVTQSTVPGGFPAPANTASPVAGSSNSQSSRH